MVLVGAVLAAAALWIFAKLLKWMIWLAIVLVLVGGAITAAKLFLEAERATSPKRPASAAVSWVGGVRNGRADTEFRR